MLMVVKKHEASAKKTSCRLSRVNIRGRLRHARPEHELNQQERRKVKVKVKVWPRTETPVGQPRTCCISCLTVDGRIMYKLKVRLR